MIIKEIKNYRFKKKHMKDYEHHSVLPLEIDQNDRVFIKEIIK
jgi:hypothetical protein